jgi:phytanoyl-CoA hydroxylase
MMLDPQQLETFDRDGYLVVHDVVDPLRDLGPIYQQYQTILDGICEALWASGHITSLYVGEPLAVRLLHVMTEVIQGSSIETSASLSQFFEISLPKGFPAKRVDGNTPLYVGSGLFNLLRTPKMLDVIESLIGPEIYANPLGHVRIKLPGWLIKEEQNVLRTGSTPWHQDGGAFEADADATDWLTAWIPLNSSTAQNGALTLVPGSHRTGVMDHCPNPVAGQASIPLASIDLDHAVVEELLPGSVIFIHKHTAHASVPNNTEDDVRLSLDVRYHKPGQHPSIKEFPGFVARSEVDPDSVEHDARAWEQQWYAARDRLAKVGGVKLDVRWDGASDVCV